MPTLVLCCMQTLNEVKLENLTKGDEILLSYWHGKHSISHGVKFLSHDDKYLFYGVSKFFGKSDTINKIALTKVRAIFKQY